MTDRIWSGLRRLGAPAVLAALTGLLAACDGGEVEEGVLPPPAARGDVVALAYDAAGARLVVAYAHALYSDGLPRRNVTAFATHADRPGTLYAVALEEGIYRSEDAGESWRRMDGGPGEPIRRLVHSNMQGSMESGWLFAATPEGVRRSMDCFCGWRPTVALPDGAVTPGPDQCRLRVCKTTRAGAHDEPVVTLRGVPTTCRHCPLYLRFSRRAMASSARSPSLHRSIHAGAVGGG